jgi:hypothetical protein
MANLFNRTSVDEPDWSHGRDDGAMDDDDDDENLMLNTAAGAGSNAAHTNTLDGDRPFKSKKTHLNSSPSASSIGSDSLNNNNDNNDSHHSNDSDDNDFRFEGLTGSSYGNNVHTDANNRTGIGLGLGGVSANDGRGGGQRSSLKRGLGLSPIDTLDEGDVTSSILCWQC